VKSDGIYGGSLKDKKVELKKLVEDDEAWAEPSRIQYFGGSLYVLDHGTGEISKYAIDKDGLLPRKRWFGRGIVLDLSKIIDFVVDGDVWMLSSSGKLEKYSRGVPANFGLEGYASEEGDKKFVGAVSVGSSEEKVYVLDNGNGRVLVFDRDGGYEKQYVNQELQQGRDVMVVGGVIYILFENEIRTFGL